MIIVYILAGLWSLGCLIGLLALCASMVFDYGGPNWFGLALSLTFGIPVAFLLGIAPWALLAYQASPDLVTLKKVDWACSASVESTTYVQSGNVLVPVTSEDCVQYSRL